ncbi:MAG: hypothetical protein A3H00_02960 [Candidatus Portnoybacteria bacterium RBG_13_40_8]|nr:MAG: hypothetical protein A3H00_02960 [Candidatus Portnoybacteria bacterium RBG_13_40_8]
MALDYLKKQNYHILDRNYQRKWGEIDIITSKDKEIVFVEVKTRKKNQNSFIGPEESVGFFKQKRLIRTAQTYLLKENYPPETNWQIDVIAVELDEQTRRANLRHIKNAVY